MLRRAIQQAWQGAKASQSSVATAPVRRFGGAHDSHAHNPNDYVAYAGLTLQKAPTGEYAMSKFIGAGMWFWIFYRFYHDWDHRVYGLAYVFDHEGDDEYHHH